MSSTASDTIPAISERRWKLGRRSLVLAAIVALPVGLYSATGSDARSVVTEFGSKAAPQAFLVPDDVCRVTIEAVAAAGGASSRASLTRRSKRCRSTSPGSASSS